MQSIITICQAGVFCSYLAYVMIKNNGALPSLSESWYRMKGLEKILFTFFCWSIGFMMLYQTDGSTGWFFLSGLGLGFTGAATMFRQDMAGKVHTAGATISILAAFLALYFERNTFVPLLVFVFSVALLYRVKNRTWWIEIIAFICILYGLL